MAPLQHRDETERARAVLDAMDAAADLAPAQRERMTDLSVGLSIQHRINTLRLARGDRPRGYKIGFTNRSIWPVYGVDAPIWAPVWQATLDDTILLAETPALAAAGRPLSRFVRPRLEPEIVLGLRAAPRSAALADVAAAIDWVAPGFEIVQSPFHDWQFSAAEAFAAQGLHGALLVGPRRRVRSPETLPALLTALSLTLSCDGRLVASGSGSAVLDGPVQALAHLVRQLAAHPPPADAFRLGAGSIVTTGTLTDAQPLAPGQTWTTRLTQPSATGPAGVSPDVLDGTLDGLRLQT